ncbi:MAG: ATP-dependent DNA ligase [Steroidobacteraceae bacterium]
MTTPFRPMLAADITDELDKLRFPVYATPKLDGVRALIFPDGVYSRSMKRIPNEAVQRAFGRPELVGLDGELIVGEPTDKDVYRRTQSVVSRLSDDTPVTFYVFDTWDRKGPYEDYIGLGLDPEDGVIEVWLGLCANLEQLLAKEEDLLNQGYEGLILRSPEGRYKNGRSTVKEGGMLKLKRFVDGEAEIIGIEEELENTNTAMTNELGRTARSSHKAGLVGKGRMGALIVRDLVTGVEFKIGTGFSADDRENFWQKRGAWAGGTGGVVKYRHFAHGAKDKPRHPTFAGMREGWDL